MNRREFLKGLVRTAVATALLPGLKRPSRNLEGVERFAYLNCNPRFFGDPDHANEPVEITKLVSVKLDDGWRGCISIGSGRGWDGVLDCTDVYDRVSPPQELSLKVELDLVKLRQHVAILDSTGGKWRIIGDFEGLKGPDGEIVL